jgi:hypothetical protein
MKRFLDWLFSLPILAAGSAIGALLVVFLSERDISTFIFVCFSFLTLFLIILLLSGRTIFATVASWTVFIVLTALSAGKLRYMELNLHVVDFYFYLRNLDVLRFITESFTIVLFVCLFILVSGFIISWLAFNRDRCKPASRVTAGVLLPVMLLGVVRNYPLSASEIGFYTAGHSTSSFFASFGDVAAFIFDKPPIEGVLSAVVSNDAFEGVPDCAKASKPDVIIVLMESAMPPATYPGIIAPPSSNEEFRSSDGSVRKLRVETFGGGTWVTTTGLMTSLPAAEFGWLRTYLPLYLQHRVHHSLPELMKNCGYRTVAISPFPYSFVNEGPFLTSLGIDEYLDSKSIRLPSLKERDSFYFNSALKFILEHRNADPRPLFLYIMTMAAHSPYNYRFDPRTKVSGEPFGNTEELDEYLRRLAMMQADFKQFVQQLAGKTSKDGAIVLEFGDHQPSAVRNMANLEAGWGSIGYQTYYKLTSIDTAVMKSLPDMESIDIEYLAPTLLEVAGLPMDDVYRDLIGLRNSCAGAFVSCLDQDKVKLHLKKLVNGRFLEFPN